MPRTACEVQNMELPQRASDGQQKSMPRKAGNMEMPEVHTHSQTRGKRSRQRAEGERADALGTRTVHAPQGRRGTSRRTTTRPEAKLVVAQALIA